LSVTFYIPGPLRGFTHGQAQVEIQDSPSTLREALALLCLTYPGLRDRVLSEEGKVREHINIFVGNESVRFLEGLTTPLPPSAQIYIIPAVSGGCGYPLEKKCDNHRRPFVHRVACIAATSKKR